jgi:transaldolase
MDYTRIKKLEALGQSIWLDYICRDLIVSGKLRTLIDKAGLRGITSNPSIFEKAIAGSHDYNDDIRTMALEGKDVQTIYETLSQRDVQSAADLFRPVHTKTEGMDGYVSLEVNPHLAHDTQGTIQEARRLWTALNRPNVLIKVPATVEGLPVIRQLLSEGINVNVTLLFGLPRYRQVVEAYLAGIEEFLTKQNTAKIPASVASFFISRIDTAVDPLLEKIITQDGKDAESAKALRGQAATASAKAAYQIYKEIFNGNRFKKLADKGVRPQRLLWASTSTKNPEYSDVKYIEALIGRDTINTIPVETLDAYCEHGEPEERIEQESGKVFQMLERLTSLGININQVTQQLEDEGVDKFNKSFDNLTHTLENAIKKNNWK